MNVSQSKWPVLGLVVALAGGVACSSSGSSTGTGGSGGSSTGTAGTSAGGSGGTTGTAGTTGGGFINPATCGEKGTATATATAYDGTTDFVIVGDAGQGAEVCVVRFTVKNVGAAQAGCPDNCSWAHLVEFTNPVVVTNMDGACDASDSVPALDAAGRARMTGVRQSRGFSLTTGHGDALLKYSDAMQMWIGVGRANWDPVSGGLGYNIANGNCNYGR
jgi:hypothetical protein